MKIIKTSIIKKWCAISITAIILCSPTVLGSLASCGTMPSDDGGVETAIAGVSRDPLANNTGIDVTGHAPWRVQSPTTTIPFTAAIFQAGSYFELHSVWVVLTQGGATRCDDTCIYAADGVCDDGGWDCHFALCDFGTDCSDCGSRRTTDRMAVGGTCGDGERSAYWVFRGDLTPFNLGTYASSQQLLVYQIDRVHNTGVPAREGLPITAENLFGSEAGDDLEFQVIVRGRRTSSSDITSYMTTLRVHVGEEELPEGRGLFAGWFSGDTHYHTMYTNNWAEYGLPHLSTIAAANAIGLSWTTTTDHSCDLDEPCFRLGMPIGNRIESWRYCTNAIEVEDCEWFDRTSLFNGWEMADNDADIANTRHGVDFFHTGEEINLRSKADMTIHALAFRANYIESRSSGLSYWGATDCYSLDLTLSKMLTAPSFPFEGMVFAAHPKQALAAEINGGTWGVSDIDDGMASSNFMGLQIWNTRMTKVAPSSLFPEEPGGLNPFPDMENCSKTESDCYPYYLDETEIPLWDRTLSRYLSKSNHQVFMIGGSDAHGDFNYMAQATGTGLEGGPVNDNAYGKVRTVVPLDAPSAEDAVEAMGRGVAIATDGPLLIFGFDITGDGTIDQTGIGEDGVLGTSWGTMRGIEPELIFRWQSTEEFGEIEEVYLYRGTSTTGDEPVKYNVMSDIESLGDCDSADSLSAECTLRLDVSSSMALPDAGERVYYRAMALSDSEMRRCLTNPIWFATEDCIDADGDRYGVGADCDLFAGIRGADCDDSRAEVFPGAIEVCNGLDDDCDGEVDNGLLRLCATSCGNGEEICTDGLWIDCDAPMPEDEICDGVDNDCDDEIDESDPQLGAICGEDQGVCEPGRLACLDGELICDGGVAPDAEICNELDDDCDGEVDEHNPGGGASCGSDEGECRAGIEECISGEMVCSGGQGPIDEVCDDADNDCDGEIDEGSVCVAVDGDGDVDADGDGDGDTDADGDGDSDGDDDEAGGGCSCSVLGAFTSFQIIHLFSTI